MRCSTNKIPEEFYADKRIGRSDPNLWPLKPSDFTLWGFKKHAIYVRIFRNSIEALTIPISQVIQHVD
jgi:hypothetical protein